MAEEIPLVKVVFYESDGEKSYHYREDGEGWIFDSIRGLAKYLFEYERTRVKNDPNWEGGFYTNEQREGILLSNEFFTESACPLVLETKLSQEELDELARELGLMKNRLTFDDE